MYRFKSDVSDIEEIECSERNLTSENAKHGVADTQVWLRLTFHVGLIETGLWLKLPIGGVGPTNKSR